MNNGFESDVYAKYASMRDKIVSSNDSFSSLSSEIESITNDIEKGFLNLIDYMFSEAWYNTRTGTWNGIDKDAVDRCILGLAKVATRELTASVNYISSSYNKVYGTLKNDLDNYVEHVNNYNNTVAKRNNAVRNYNAMLVYNNDLKS